jgi:hypothetical protein
MLGEEVREHDTFPESDEYAYEFVVFSCSNVEHDAQSNACPD